jgi:hypothetical protein
MHPKNVLFEEWLSDRTNITKDCEKTSDKLGQQCARRTIRNREFESRHKGISYQRATFFA